MRPPRRMPRRESGSVMVLVLSGLVALIGFTALGIDVGLTYNARTQAQAAADASALAAALNMIGAGGVTLASGTTEAIGVASQNAAYPNPSLVLGAGDVTYGDWDWGTRTLDTSVDLTNVSNVTGVQTVIRLDDGLNQAVPAVMAQVLGIDRFTVDAVATAYLGFAGALGPGEIELPIAIPCCVLKGPNCTNDCSDAATCEDWCASGGPKPNPCPLSYPPYEQVTCIELFSTPEQTGCWTEYDSYSTSINTPGLNEIATYGYDGDVYYKKPIYLDNGTKTPVVQTIFDRFYGLGDFAASKMGSDTNADGITDSWITGLPVVNCQDDMKCATGNPAVIVGFVCMEINEVLVAPEKIIKATFLCPTLHQAKYQQCLDGLGPTGSGGLDFGIRADIPVLVR